MWKKLIKTFRRRAPVDAAAPHMRNLRGGRFVKKFDFLQIQSPVTKDPWELSFEIYFKYFCIISRIIPISLFSLPAPHHRKNRDETKGGRTWDK